MSDFTHITIDLSIGEMKTPDDTISICQVETNVPLCFSGEESKELPNIYVMGCTIEPCKPVELDVKPFSLIIARCHTHINCYAAAQSGHDGPSFMWSVIEEDEAIEVGPPNITFGAKTDFCLISFETTQRLRIETISDIDVFYHARDSAWRRQEEKKLNEEM